MKKILLLLFFVLISADYAQAKELSESQRAQMDYFCVQNCGNGFFYDRLGSGFHGQEVVCTKYPLQCGYDCTVGWDIAYAAGTYFTCQEAIQTTEKKENHFSELKKKLTELKDNGSIGKDEYEFYMNKISYH